jgi:Tol biopolymer transport system component
MPHARSPIWSPDSKHVLFLGASTPTGFGVLPDYEWWVVPVEGGKPVRLDAAQIFQKAGLSVGPLIPRASAWLPDNRILFSASLKDGPPNLWQFSIVGRDWRLIGEPQRLTSGTGEEHPSGSAGGRLVFTNIQYDADVGSVSVNPNTGKASGSLQSVVTGMGRDHSPSVSADGSLMVYVSTRSGNPDVWLRNLKTGQEQPVTVTREPEQRAVISPDGSRVAFVRVSQPPRVDLYLADTSGRRPEQLLLEGIGNVMDWLPDGKRLLYYTRTPIRWMILRVDSRETSDIDIDYPEHPVHDLRFSPDQRWVSFKIFREPRRMGPMYIARIDGLKVTPKAEWVPIADPLWNGRNWWSPDGRLLYFLSLRDGFWCIWIQRLNAATKKPIGEPEALLHFHGRQRLNQNQPGYGLAPDRLYFSFSETRGNIWIADPL